MMSATRTQRGFTLIELLVVISIIALLVAILLPALAQARSAAQGVQCMSNQRQVSISMFSYQAEHDDYFIPYWIRYFGDGLTSNAPVWTGQLWRLGYVPDLRTYGCPGFEARTYPLDWNTTDGAGAETWANGSAWAVTDFGYNHMHVGSSYRYPPLPAAFPHGNLPRSTDMRSPSAQLLIADSRRMDGGFVNGYYIMDDSPLNRRPNGRHQGPALAVTWVDGHTSMLSVEDPFDPYTNALGRGTQSDSMWDRY